MREDDEGFLYPVVNGENCISCGLCEKICPALNHGDSRQPLQVYAAKNQDGQIQLNSSSGGIFTLLAEQIINEGGVIFGARFNDNWEVIHDYTETVEGLSVFRSSKYVQSIIGETYRQAKAFLLAGRQVLFSGTPCQIAGLKTYLQRDYENLLSVDLVCHGVPSPAVWREYLRELAGVLDFSKINSINFRDKTHGWKLFSFSICYTENINSSGVFLESLQENVFMRGFLRNLYLRPSCYQCPVKFLSSGSDITLGDYWGIQNTLPEFDDDKGVSLVMINTLKGKVVYGALNKHEKETSYNNALRGNSTIEESVPVPIKRTDFFENRNNEPITDLIVKLTKISVLRRIWNKARIIFWEKIHR
jgi:coenzyme F420-reducing hydrogenase beta subunit